MHERERGKNLNFARHKHVEGRCYARANAADKIDILESEFVFITETLMRASPDAASIRAARRVLMEGMTQKQACLTEDCREGTLSTCLTRIRTQHSKALAAYAARIEQPESKSEYPPCDYCGVIPTYHPWHGSGILNGVESRHIHACNDCRKLLIDSIAATL